jgi:hypothetical protein
VGGGGDAQTVASFVGVLKARLTRSLLELGWSFLYVPCFLDSLSLLWRSSRVEHGPTFSTHCSRALSRINCCSRTLSVPRPVLLTLRRYGYPLLVFKRADIFSLLEGRHLPFSRFQLVLELTHYVLDLVHRVGISSSFVPLYLGILGQLRLMLHLALPLKLLLPLEVIYRVHHQMRQLRRLGFLGWGCCCMGKQLFGILVRNERVLMGDYCPAFIKQAVLLLFVALQDRSALGFQEGVARLGGGLEFARLKG